MNYELGIATTGDNSVSCRGLSARFDVDLIEDILQVIQYMVVVKRDILIDHATDCIEVIVDYIKLPSRCNTQTG